MPRLLAASISSTSSAVPARMATAVLAGIVGRGGRAVRAVDAASQNFGRRGFARAARSGKEIGVRELSAFDRRGQRADDGILADEVGKRPGAPGTVQGHAR